METLRRTQDGTGNGNGDGSEDSNVDGNRDEDNGNGNGSEDSSGDGNGDEDNGNEDRIGGAEERRRSVRNRQSSCRRHVGNGGYLGGKMKK